jgi:hypothetical protein
VKTAQARVYVGTPDVKYDDWVAVGLLDQGHDDVVNFGRAAIDARGWRNTAMVRISVDDDSVVSRKFIAQTKRLATDILSANPDEMHLMQVRYLGRRRSYRRWIPIGALVGWIVVRRLTR